MELCGWQKEDVSVSNGFFRPLKRIMKMKLSICLGECFFTCYDKTS